ncbi:MAG: hypothetical protein DWQ04_13000 [Chloroflexi bacterium]|nr:MAG: hypothetical protein DWQ04_13000 [Chloroflexota bacterium]
MKIWHDFKKVLDFHIVLVMGLAVLSTYLCRQLGWVADLPANLIGIAVIFPLVFSINSAYRRREEALKAFASLKGHMVALVFAHRDWSGRNPDIVARGLELMESLFTAVNDHFSNTPNKKSTQEVFHVFSQISESHEKMREAGVPDLSRANQYLRSIMIEFERMNNIARYRTPVALRAYSRIFLNLFPILFGPYFANVSFPNMPFLGYVVAALYAMVLVSLDNIQDHLENPFDGVGPDDLRLDISDYYKQLV